MVSHYCVWIMVVEWMYRWNEKKEIGITMDEDF